ncbi:energy-coupling factor transporter transmembrane component T family protein [Sporolactobacillus vineae]|uniref:energy-coupling factor transporter transmembrane component T family protein n=1 Tax=Sporolactobacillus vineae TaxID=444463 RepID=UPI000288288B|nr:energy-coupling factor transporter transmembrane component T [Sporolactobacillus vineae]
MDPVITDTSKLFFKVNPSLKLICFAFLFILYLSVQNLNTMIWTTVAFSIVTLWANGLPRKWSVGFFLMTFIVSFFSASAMILYGKGSHVLFQWFLIRTTEESLARGIQLGLRTFVFGLLGVLFASTTPPVPFFYSLMQQLKVPVRYAYGCLAAFRMLPMMAEELGHIRQAMKVRGMSRQKGLRAFYERFLHYALGILVQSIRRAQRTAVAMEAKRFSMKEKRTFYYQIGWSRKDLIFLSVMTVTVVSGFLLSRWIPLTPYTNVIDGY